MPTEYSDQELQKLVKSGGWKDDQGNTGTLEDVLKANHARKARGEKPNFIRQLETEIELDLLQVEKLWRYLGLPV